MDDPTEGIPPLFQWDQDGGEDYLDFLNRLPPELLERLTDGKAVIGTPQLGYELMGIYATDNEDMDAWFAHLRSYTDIDEVREAIAHLVALQMVAVAMRHALVMRALELRDSEQST